MSINILKPWTEKLGLRHQGCLMSAIRGCDNLPKNDPSKALSRVLRGVLLNAFSTKPSSFIEFVEYDELQRRMTDLLSDFDHYPVHYILHLLHAAEIIGYKHPDNRVADPWRWFYSNLVRCFHLYPETETQMDARLGACEDQFADSQKAAV